MNRQRVLASILSLWGAAVVISAIVKGLPGHGAYRTGEYAAVIFGIAIVAFGLRQFRRDFYKPFVRPQSSDDESLK